MYKPLQITFKTFIFVYRKTVGPTDAKKVYFYATREVR